MRACETQYQFSNQKDSHSPNIRGEAFVKRVLRLSGEKEVMMKQLFSVLLVAQSLFNKARKCTTGTDFGFLSVCCVFGYRKLRWAGNQSLIRNYRLANETKKEPRYIPSDA